MKESSNKKKRKRIFRKPLVYSTKIAEIVEKKLIKQSNQSIMNM